LTEPVIRSDEGVRRLTPVPGVNSFDEVEADLEFIFRGPQKTSREMVHLLTDSKDAESVRKQ